MPTIIRTDLDTAPKLVDTIPEYAGEGDTTIAVEYSSLNYKDAKVLRGDRDVVRTQPLVPGIDVVGTISDGTLVTINGTGLGEFRHGGYTDTVNVDGDGVIPVPARMTAQQAAAVGTAGFTAALSVLEISRAVNSTSGPVLVTGSTGGVGSIVVMLLHSLGYHVIASTGRTEELGDYLRGLGADEVMDRSELSEPGRPLQSRRWAGVVDTVGSHTLVNAVAQGMWGATITTCGMAQGGDYHGTVFPFILRGTRLIGINSVDCPRALRFEAWELIDAHLDLDLLDSITTSVDLAGVVTAGADLLDGRVRGRTVVRVK